MKIAGGTCLLFVLIFGTPTGSQQAPLPARGLPLPHTPSDSANPIQGFRDSSLENALESRFLSVPDPRLAEQHLKVLTQAPHIAGSREDKATADYVAEKFRAAGLDTQIIEYRVWMNYPVQISVDATAPAGLQMHGPTREHVDGDSFQDDPRVVTPYNGMSPSGDVEADVVYANYGSPEDFKKLEDLKVDVRGKIVLVRYGQNFRGVKAYVAQEHSAAGIIIYSDPADDGWKKGDKYPKGPWRPDTGVQRGSIGYMFEFSGDPTTPGAASVLGFDQSKRTPPEDSAQLPKIPSTPLSYHDVWPLLENLGGPESPRDWQGALPFTYHVGPGPVRVKMHLKQDYQLRTIWDVIGKVQGTDALPQWVIAGNHRDAWVYGAVDPNSGTAALLESVHGIGELLKSGWKPKRTVVFGSWDAEEQGLIGSTEWGEEYASDLATASAYFNMDVAVSGPKFGASAVPSLKQFIREIAKAVPSPKGATVYDAWRKTSEPGTEKVITPQEAIGDTHRAPAAQAHSDVPVGDLGSGSDYTVFLQHLGVPSTDVGSSGSYGVYHSVFDNFDWFKKFGDPDFSYEQQMARIYGLEVLRMANADVLPYDYEEYGKEISAYIDSARKRAETKFAGHVPDFGAASEAARRLTTAGAAMAQKQRNPRSDTANLNRILRQAEGGLLIPEGLPNRPWYRHAIYAPGVYTGYAAVVIPGVNEAIDAGNLDQTRQQIAALAAAVNRSAAVLEGYK